MQRRSIITVFGIAAIICFFVSMVLALNTDLNIDKTFYPYYPSLLKWNKTRAEFTSPETCADCHPEKYEEWRGSIHFFAFKDPVYQGELNKAYKAAGHEITRQCEGCHTPIGMMGGETKGAGLKGLSPVALAGVSCDVCHSVSGHTHWQTPSHQPENGSMILSPGYDIDGGSALTKYGPFPPEKECGEDFHECLESPLHLQAELCASCHQVTHYKTNTLLEATYQEWKNGPYSVNGIRCQDCHMVDFATFVRTADTLKKPDQKEYRHFFNGANFLVYNLMEKAAIKAGDEELANNIRHKYEMAVSRLKAVADLEVHPIYYQGRLAEIKVRVKNLRAGHNLPTSLTNIRQIWLEVTVKDKNGKVLMTTGIIDANGDLPPEVRRFNSEGIGGHFHFALNP
ncbi:MAG: cytochrome C, partial [Proteobacteria bacterium]|nr:cytochrome C [Pseudomonadota bacterium]